jgi:2-iminoacetate synthase ThiH
MMEENVVSEAGVAFRLSLQDMQSLIEDAGFVAAQRDNDYRLIGAAA